jgi:succinate dehydrogenase hydrophobic anchor subunit
MNDTTSETDKPREVSAAALVVFNKRFEQVDFLKKQQWTLTNYVAAIYGAIFGLSRFSSPTAAIWLQLLILVVFIYGFYGLFVIQSDLQEARTELDKAIDWIFGEYEEGIDERKYVVGPTGNRGPWRDFAFSFGLMAVLIGGAVLACWGKYGRADMAPRTGELDSKTTTRTHCLREPGHTRSEILSKASSLSV